MRHAYDHSGHARPAQQEVAERALAKSAENTIEQREVRTTLASRNGKQQDQADNRLVAPGANVLVSEQRNRPAPDHPQHHDPEAQVGFLQSTLDSLFLFSFSIRTRNRCPPFVGKVTSRPVGRDGAPSTGAIRWDCKRFDTGRQKNSPSFDGPLEGQNQSGHSFKRGGGNHAVVRFPNAQ